MMDNIAIGERLKEARTRGKFTQKQVCDELEIPNIQTLSSYEHGKGLTANRSGQWRYRIGDYRLICQIEDDRLVILALNIGHRSEVYKSL